MITVLFTCKGCGLTKVRAKVCERRRDEDVTAWVEQHVMRAVGAAHRRLSPKCTHGKADIMLPLPDDAEWVGQKDFAPKTPESPSAGGQ